MSGTPGITFRERYIPRSLGEGGSREFRTLLLRDALDFSNALAFAVERTKLIEEETTARMDVDRPARG